MNIVIVSTAFPLRGGIAHFNALLAKHLRSRHTVETVTFKRQYPSFLFPGKTQDESSAQIDDSVIPAPQLIDSINPFNWVSVGNAIARRKPDLIIFKYWMPFFGPCFGTIAKIVKKKTGAKALFICDNIIPHERRPGDIAFTKYAFSAADYFLVQSQSVERDLNKHFPGAHYKLIPHPVYENFGTAIEKERARKQLTISQRRVMLFFGYIRQYKGLMTLIDAVNLLVQRGTLGKDFLLMVVGEFYDDEQKYRKKVQELNLEQYIRFYSDYVPNNEVAKYFSATDVVVLPYRSATQSGIIQIAYNFDKPVIATNVGGLAEVIVEGKTGSLVPPENPEALSSALAEFFEHSREEEYSANVREEKKKYSWEYFIAQLEELIHSR